MDRHHLSFFTQIADHLFPTDDDKHAAAAAAIAYYGWRLPIENDHADGTITDPQIMVANMMTTELAKDWLQDDRARRHPDWLVDELADPDRSIGNGLTVGDASTHNLADDVLISAMIYTDLAESEGHEIALAIVATGSIIFTSRWWGMPWWPAAVDDVLAETQHPPAGARTMLVDAPSTCTAEVAAWAINHGTSDAASRHVRDAWARVPVVLHPA